MLAIGINEKKFVPTPEKANCTWASLEGLTFSNAVATEELAAGDESIVQRGVSTSEWCLSSATDDGRHDQWYRRAAA